MSFVEYPKMIYRQEEPSQKIVMNAEEEAAAVKEGYQLAEDFFAQPQSVVDGDGAADTGKGKKKK